MNEIWSALSDSTRRKILELLKKKDLTAGEIAENFSMSKPSISHHLSILRGADLVSSEKKGQQVIYSINTTIFQDVLTFIAKLSEKGANEL